MNSSIQIFNNNEFSVRTTRDDDGTIWFVAKDIALALEYSEATVNNNISNLFKSVPDIWAGNKPFIVRSENGVAQEREMLCLTEQGVYFFLGRSDKPKALKYQMWIAGDVVPSIRKHGMYVTPQAAEQILNDPDVFIRVLQELKNEREKAKALADKIETDKPKVIFAESVETSKNSILIRELAKLLRQNGYIVGQNRLFAELRERGYLMKTGSDYNMPTQKSMELGLMEILERTINRGEGQILVKRTPKITGKGQIYFVNMFLRQNREVEKR